ANRCDVLPMIAEHARNEGGGHLLRFELWSWLDNDLLALLSRSDAKPPRFRDLAQFHHARRSGHPPIVTPLLDLGGLRWVVKLSLPIVAIHLHFDPGNPNPTRWPA